jgi:hypothetical protein
VVANDVAGLMATMGSVSVAAARASRESEFFM